MSYDAYSISGSLIRYEHLKDIVQNEVMEFESYQAEYENESGVKFDEYEEWDDKLIGLWGKVCTAFDKMTGLRLSGFVEYDSEAGSVYDPSIVSERCLFVDGVYQKTPAAQALGDKIEWAEWVQFG